MLLFMDYIRFIVKNKQVQSLQQLNVLIGTGTNIRLLYFVLILVKYN